MLIILFLFSETFKIVNDKQTTDELNMTIFTRQHNNCRIDRTKQYTKLMLAFRYLAKFLRQPFMQKENVFYFKL